MTPWAFFLASFIHVWLADRCSPTANVQEWILHNLRNTYSDGHEIWWDVGFCFVFKFCGLEMRDKQSVGLIWQIRFSMRADANQRRFHFCFNIQPFQPFAIPSWIQLLQCTVVPHDWKNWKTALCVTSAEYQSWAWYYGLALQVTSRDAPSDNRERADMPWAMISYSSMVELLSERFLMDCRVKVVGFKRL